MATTWVQMKLLFSREVRLHGFHERYINDLQKASARLVQVAIEVFVPAP